MTEIVARLAKSRNLVTKNGGTYRVLCGWQVNGNADCGEYLATVRVGDWVRTYTEGLPSPLEISPGWTKGKDGTWCLTRHASKALQRAHSIASGTEDGSGRTTRARERLGNGSAYAYRRPMDRWLGPDESLDVEPPFWAQCPRCGRINEVTLALVTEALARWLKERDG